MEGNRDEAEKCVEIAREALNAGNREKAQRFLQKAEKLYPLPSARGEALDVPSLPAGSPHCRVARLRPHHRSSGSRRGRGSADPSAGRRGGASRHTSAPAPTVSGRAAGGPGTGCRDSPCVRDAGCQLTGESYRLPDPFSEMSGCHSLGRVCLGYLSSLVSVSPECRLYIWDFGSAALPVPILTTK